MRYRHLLGSGQGAAPQPTVHRTAPTTKACLLPDATSAQAEKPCSVRARKSKRVLTSSHHCRDTFGSLDHQNSLPPAICPGQAGLYPPGTQSFLKAPSALKLGPGALLIRQTDLGEAVWVCVLHLLSPTPSARPVAGQPPAMAPVDSLGASFLPTASCLPTFPLLLPALQALLLSLPSSPNHYPLELLRTWPQAPSLPSLPLLPLTVLRMKAPQGQKYLEEHLRVSTQ